MNTTDKENLLEFILPSFGVHHRLPVFKEITERQDEETKNPSSSLTNTSPSKPIINNLSTKYSPTPEEIEHASHTVEVYTSPELLTVVASNIIQMFALQVVSFERNKLCYYFEDIRDAVWFIKKGKQLLSGVKFAFVSGQEEVIGIRTKNYEVEMIRIMKKVGDLMRVKKLNAETTLFWYYSHKAYEQSSRLLNKFARKRRLLKNKPETRIRKQALKFRKVEPLEINNAELYCGIKKRSNATEEKDVFVVDLNMVISGKDTRTTIMIKNIPNKYNQRMLLDTINANHKNTYDFFYLPIDFKNRCNVGYAFINFKHAFFLVAFYNEFNGKKWKRFNSEKVCSITYGRVQGLKALIEHFRSSSVMIQTDSRLKPLILDN